MSGDRPISTSAALWLAPRLARWRVGLKPLGSAALDLLYPPACLVCRVGVGDGAALCPRCWSRMRFIERPYCERLGTPFSADFAADPSPGGVGRALSPQAIADPPVYRRARAVVCFDDGPARILVHRLKYGDRGELAKPMGRWMARAGEDVLGEADALVPIPLHRGRLFQRKFNQAAALAHAISTHCGVPVETMGLLRVKATASQVGLSRNQRALNLQGAFKVAEARSQAFAAKNAVLIDDVATSGATLNAAARTLLRAGAARVDALVFARVVTDA